MSQEASAHAGSLQKVPASMDQMVPIDIEYVLRQV